MKWHRVEPGVYTSGPYTVEYHNTAGGFWTAAGPGIAPAAHPTKHLAQIECGETAASRAADPVCVPIVGDIVMVLDDYRPHRRGQITSIHKGLRPDDDPLYCVTFPRARRLCLLRREIEVLVP